MATAAALVFFSGPRARYDEGNTRGLDADL